VEPPLPIQFRVLAAQVLYLSVEKAVVPENLEGLFDEFERAKGRGRGERPLPVLVSFLAHRFEKGAQNGFLIAEMKVEVSRADPEVLADMIRGSSRHAPVVKELHGSGEDAGPVPGAFCAGSWMASWAIRHG
jgi:hypothetical protein